MVILLLTNLCANYRNMFVINKREETRLIILLVDVGRSFVCVLNLVVPHARATPFCGCARALRADTVTLRLLHNESSCA